MAWRKGHKPMTWPKFRLDQKSLDQKSYRLDQKSLDQKSKAWRKGHKPMTWPKFRLDQKSLEQKSFTGADPGFFVGGGQTKKRGQFGRFDPHMPWYGPQFSPSTGHFCLYGPDFGPKLALFTTEIRNSLIRYQCFGQKNGAFSCRGGGQGTLAPAPGSAPDSDLTKSHWLDIQKAKSQWLYQNSDLTKSHLLDHWTKVYRPGFKCVSCKIELEAASL